MPSITLKRLSGFGRGKSERFDETAIALGTDASCAMRFDPAWDKTVSPQHASLEYKSETWVLSSQGPSDVLLDGRKISGSISLQTGDAFELGEGGPKVSVDFEKAPPQVVRAVRVTPTPSKEPVRKEASSAERVEAASAARIAPRENAASDAAESPPLSEPSAESGIGYFDVLKKYVQFSGRARRKEYWMFFLFNMIISFALLAIEGAFEGPGIAYMLYFLGVFLPGLAVSIRRLHDTGRSGWFLFISMIPLIGPIVLLVFMVQDSELGENEYGENPKGA